MSVDCHNTFDDIVDDGSYTALTFAQLRRPRGDDAAKRPVPHQDTDQNEPAEQDDRGDDDGSVDLKSRSVECDPSLPDLSVLLLADREQSLVNQVAQHDPILTHGKPDRRRPPPVNWLCPAGQSYATRSRG